MSDMISAGLTKIRGSAGNRSASITFADATGSPSKKDEQEEEGEKKENEEEVDTSTAPASNSNSPPEACASDGKSKDDAEKVCDGAKKDAAKPDDAGGDEDGEAKDTTTTSPGKFDSEDKPQKAPAGYYNKRRSTKPDFDSHVGSPASSKRRNSSKGRKSQNSSRPSVPLTFGVVGVPKAASPEKYKTAPSNTLAADQSRFSSSQSSHLKISTSSPEFDRYFLIRELKSPK